MGHYCGGLGWGNWGHMGGWSALGFVGPLFGVLLLVGLLGVVALGAVWLARRSSPTVTIDQQPGQDPLQIAQRRLAAGELTGAEFEEIRERLQH